MSGHKKKKKSGLIVKTIAPRYIFYCIIIIIIIIKEREGERESFKTSNLQVTEYGKGPKSNHSWVQVFIESFMWEKKTKGAARDKEKKQT